MIRYARFVLSFAFVLPAAAQDRPNSTGATSTVDSPEYLAWKKFQPGSKASYVNDVLHEFKPGTNQYTKTRISAFTLTLESIDDQRAVVKVESTVSGKIGGRNNPDTHSSDQRIIRARRIEGPGAPMDDPTQRVTRGEETLVINGKQISARWQCVTRADDPLTFTKKWTSADVPGGLVRTQQQSHSQIVGETYRDIKQTLYAPIDGVEPQLGDATSPSPWPAGNAAPGRAGGNGATTNPTQPAPVPVAPPQPRGRPNPSATSPATQAEFMKYYSAVMTRAAEDRLSLAQAERKLSVASGSLPDQVHPAQTRLTSQQQAVGLAMRTRDNTAAEQSLRDMEDTMVVIEKFIGK